MTVGSKFFLSFFLYILPGARFRALSAGVHSPLTFSMEDIHICDSVCLRYVDDTKLSVFQSNVKYLKLKNIQNYLKSGSMACKVSILY